MCLLCVLRCVGDEVSSRRWDSYQGCVLIPFSLCGQHWPVEGTGGQWTNIIYYSMKYGTAKGLASLHLTHFFRCYPFPQSHYTEADCTFRELLLADGYSRFFSSHHKLYVSLTSKGSTPQHGLPFHRFLPLRNILVSRSMTNTAENQQQNQQQLDLDSDNPFGRGLTGVVSPQFSRDKWSWKLSLLMEVYKEPSIFI